MGGQVEATGPDFAAGVAVETIPDGTTLAGRVGEEPVLVSRRGERFFAIAGACTHYGAALADGLVAGDHVRCPWHHACFDLTTGEAIAAPAFSPLKRWRAELQGDRVFVREPLDAAPARRSGPVGAPGRILIIGAGAAGFAAADMLRRRGHAGAITMLSADSAAPYDRPNLSKDYLAGTAPEEWIPLRDDDYYREQEIDLRLNTEVVALDLTGRTAATLAGESFAFDALLLATGATPVRPNLPGFDRTNVYLLRSLVDARAIIERAERAHRAAVIGAGFIGLEAAAALRTRGLEIDVVAPDQTPLLRVMGPQIGGFVRKLHEDRGVRFHLGCTAEAFDGARLRLSNGETLDADFVVVGVGVRPNTQLAAAAGLRVESGIIVDDRLRTSAAGVFAAGDIARYRDARLGQDIRIEHWVAAQRQGQVAALNMLGEDAPMIDAPYFWSNHYDCAIRYVGHAAQWDEVAIDGSIERADFTAKFMLGGRVLACASVGRDRENVALHEQMNAEAGAA